MDNKAAFNDKVLDTFQEMVEAFHSNSTSHGFYDDINSIREQLPESFRDRFDVLVAGEKIALMHSELSEALEGYRKDPTAPDQHCPEFSIEEVEMADAVIRICDWAGERNLRLGAAILAKSTYNASRPFKHGKKS